MPSLISNTTPKEEKNGNVMRKTVLTRPLKWTICYATAFQEENTVECNQPQDGLEISCTNNILGHTAYVSHTLNI